MNLAVLRDHKVVEERLSGFGTTRNEILEIVLAAVAARNESVRNDPNTAAGLLSWIYGTRRLREIFLPKGWKLDRDNGLESVVNEDSGIKIVFQNASCAADPLHAPRALSRKGPGSARAVDLGQYFLFPTDEPVENNNATIWYLFVYIDGDDIRAEFSCPRSIENDQFKGFHERIFLLEKGELDEIQLEDDENATASDFEVSVTRRES